MPDLHIVTVVGARPQFVKAAVVSRLIDEDPAATETLIHTGQHYDRALSEDFFEELALPKPSVNLGVGSGSQGRQTARMLEGIESVLLETKPHGVLLYGDTNSTLAAALAAAKLEIPIAHVEAGLRSYNRRMPEEVNRLVTDHMAGLLFCPTAQAVRNLEREGIREGVYMVGDVMFDVLQKALPRIEERTAILAEHGLKVGEYVVGTVHRAENTDDPARLEALMAGLERLSAKVAVVLPLHPRTRAAWTSGGRRALPKGPLFLEPVPYLTMLALVKEAAAVVTDSGGLQKESAWLLTPCMTLRDETEWVETVESGWNVLVGTDPEKLLRAWEALPRTGELPDLSGQYGGGEASSKIVSVLKEAWQR